MLNPAKLKSLPCGDHSDGHGLFLSVVERGGAIERIWTYRFTDLEGKRQRLEFAKLGDKDSDLKDVLCLSGARDRVREFRVDLKQKGIDPRVKKRLETKAGITFKEFADNQYPDWCKGKSPEEEKQWKRSIADMSLLHARKLHEIETDHVLAALKTIWFGKPITADRTRQRLERLFDAAKALKLRTGDNPAVWRGNLKPLLPSPRRLNRQKKGGKKGHASVPYGEAPALMVALSYDTGISARCTEVGILTAARSQEVRLMEWDEINLDKKQWTIPAEKMKVKGEQNPKPHLVPLSDQAIATIKSMPRTGRYVFPSDKVADHQPFFANALAGCIKRAGFKATMHGMRSTFRNWGGESVKHNFRREVLEHCLSHRVGDESELSYWTAEMVERRRITLQAWADYIKPKRKPKSAPDEKPQLRLVRSVA